MSEKVGHVCMCACVFTSVCVCVCVCVCVHLGMVLRERHSILLGLAVSSDCEPEAL
jgi:hypothetical protein